MRYLRGATVLSICLLFVLSAQAETGRHLNLVAFQSKTLNYEYESIVTGELGHLIGSMARETNIVFATHTSTLEPSDIINLQVDVMRMTDEKKLANSGLNCRFIFGDESDEATYFYSISGLCDQLSADEQGTKHNQILIKRMMLSDPSSMNIWMKFYEDKTLGIAFYVDID